MRHPPGKSSQPACHRAAGYKAGFIYPPLASNRLQQPLDIIPLRLRPVQLPGAAAEVVEDGAELRRRGARCQSLFARRAEAAAGLQLTAEGIGIGAAGLVAEALALAARAAAI